jgi:undecaprenyl pyrophosphate synthase
VQYQHHLTWLDQPLTSGVRYPDAAQASLAVIMLSMLRRLVQLFLYAGPIPKHVAFIMDGNRRFAERQGMERLDGHRQGYKKVKMRSS